MCVPLRATIGQHDSLDSRATNFLRRLSSNVDPSSSCAFAQLREQRVGREGDTPAPLAQPARRDLMPGASPGLDTTTARLRVPRAAPLPANLFVGGARAPPALTTASTR